VDAVDPWPPADPLGEALHFLRMNGAFYCRSDLTAPWGMTLPPMPSYIWFHVVTAGRLWLETEDGHSEWVQPGELSLVPHGKGHRLHSEPGAPAPPILDLPLEQVSDRYEVLRYGGGGTRTRLICGAVRFDHPAARNLVEILPAAIHIQASESPETDWMQSTLRLMAAEARQLRPGGEAVLTRLADILVIQALRSWIETEPTARTGWLGALRDRQIGRALALIHRDPARAWTVASLAREIPMSRSAFAARFSELVDEPAMQYVTRWRMQLAHNALKEEGATVAELAQRLGYRSEAAFARAFKRVIGVPPGAVKKEIRAETFQIAGVNAAG
jgi:AraC-like DNA-binding protein